MKIELGTSLYCIKNYGLIKKGDTYPIKGCGDLSLMHGTIKKGFGFSIDIERYDKRRKNWWNHRIETKTYYITEKEASEYFCDIDLIDKQNARYEKINKLV